MKMKLITRPFQPFLLGAKDLLRLARPYYLQIEEKRKLYEKTGRIEPVPDDGWRIEKSLSIGSFTMMYAGLEALVNCAHEDFNTRDIASLPDRFFPEGLAQVRRKVAKKPFKKWRLPNRVFLLAPMCTTAELDPTKIFDVLSSEWLKFEEAVEIRHSFSHAFSHEVEHEVSKTGPGLWTTDDRNPANFWPRTEAPRDHRTLNYEAVVVLNDIIGWVVQQLRIALPEQLSDTYMTQETARVS